MTEEELIRWWRATFGDAAASIAQADRLLKLPGERKERRLQFTKQVLAAVAAGKMKRSVVNYRGGQSSGSIYAVTK